MRECESSAVNIDVRAMVMVLHALSTRAPAVLYDVATEPASRVVLPAPTTMLLQTHLHVSLGICCAFLCAPAGKAKDHAP